MADEFTKAALYGIKTFNKKVKEKIGMEKLIELLNEYAKELGIGDYVGWHNKKTVENSDYIITKKFGFIKWLVKNDKIDRDKGEGDFYYDKLSLIIEPYERLLMLLAIQDEPIEFLISILK